MPRLALALTLLLFSFSMLRPLGTLLGWKGLASRAAAFQLTLLKDPLGLPDAHDRDPRLGAWIGCQTAAGQWQEAKFDSRAWNYLRGPHSFKVFLMSRFKIRGENFKPDSRRWHAWSWALCSEESRLHELLGCGPQPLRFRLRLREYNKPELEGEWEGRCP